MPRPFALRARQFARAVLGRCPLCGTPWRRVGWVGLVSQCGTCHVHLERHEMDSFLGAYTLNLFATLMVSVLVTIANVLWLDAPAPWRYGLGFVAIVGFAIGFYPISKLLWLAFDVQFRPPAERDFEDPEDAVRRRL